ncbi:hypothetical protein [Pendulispora albinea]|uniref:Lipoprotein n=1 Tax=Pendulispora albinea TaxID=2741071 RepID=A0ABZ2LTX1_9BACT
MNAFTSALVASALTLLASGCSRPAEPEKNPPASKPEEPAAKAQEPAAKLQEPAAKAQDPAASGTPAPGAGAAGHEITWEAPASWTKSANTNAMRKATYRIPKAAGDTDDTDLSVTVAGGSSTANVDRWIGQFSPGAAVDKKERTVSGIKVTVVEIKGTYGGGMSGPGMAAPSGPKEHFTMLAAIASADGQDSTFFKMVGPDKTVKAARSDFDKLVDSLRSR